MSATEAAPLKAGDANEALVTALYEAHARILALHDEAFAKWREGKDAFPIPPKQQRLDGQCDGLLMAAYVLSDALTLAVRRVEPTEQERGLENYLLEDDND